MQWYDSPWYIGPSTVSHITVVEQDEVQETKLLGPDGQPYAIRRPKAKLGFDLTPVSVK